VRERLGLWLRRLTAIGVMLSGVIGERAERRPAAAVTIAELRHAWSLVARALRWARALRARLVAPPAGKRPERLLDAPDWHEKLNDWDDNPFAAKREPKDCIAGLSDEQVVGHICCDLHAAATVLGDVPAIRLVEQVVEAMQGWLLGEAALPEAPVAPPPVAPGAPGGLTAAARRRWTPDRRDCGAWAGTTLCRLRQGVVVLGVLLGFGPSPRRCAAQARPVASAQMCDCRSPRCGRGVPHREAMGG
jgi:hypothetical protein